MNTQFTFNKIIKRKSRLKDKISQAAPAIIIFTILFLLLGTELSLYSMNVNLHRSEAFEQKLNDEQFLREYQEGRDFIAREEWSKASEKFNKIIREYPKHTMTDAILYWLAFSYKKQNKFQEAEETLERLTQEFPSSPWARDAKVMSVEISPRLRKEQTTVITSPPSRRKSETLQIIVRPGGKETEVIPEPPLDVDSELRLEALRSLLLSDEKEALEAASKILRLDTESEILKRNVMFLIARSKATQAASLIIEVVRQERNPQLRKTAISVLGGMTEDAAGDFLLQLFDAETDTETKRQALFALSRHKRGVPKLLEISKGQFSPEFRKIAVFRLGHISGEKVVDFLVQLYDSESDQKIKSETLSALGHTRNKRAIKKLIAVARQDPSPQMKKDAVTALGGSNDPEAITFLQEITNK